MSEAPGLNECSEYLPGAFRQGGKKPLFSREEAKDFIARTQRQDPGHGLDPRSGADSKVFWFFSSEKNILPSYHTDSIEFV
jgi:hypothetical protein